MDCDKEIDLFIVGEALVDFVPLQRGALERTEGFEVFSGGAPCNVAIGSARRGGKIAYCTVLGNDPFGHMLLSCLKQEGVNTSAVRVTDEDQTGLCFITLDSTGERSFLHRGGHVSTLLGPNDIIPELLHQTSAFLFTIGSLRKPQGCDAVRKAIEEIHQTRHPHPSSANGRPGLVLCDPGICPGNWGHTGVVQQRLYDMIPHCDVVKCSSAECEFVTGKADPEEAARWLLDQGVTLAVITLGPDGAMWMRKNDRGSEPSPIVEIVDTTGAGDAFMSAMSLALSRAGELSTLSSQQISEIIRCGCAAGAEAVTHRGALARSNENA